MFLSVLIGLVAAAPLRGQDQAAPAPFPVPDKANLRQYGQDATAFLRENPTSPYAPRVLVDLIMVSQITKNTTFADRLKAGLLTQYPTSIEAAYLMTSFADATAYRKFLTQSIPADLRLKIETNLARQFYTLVKLGQRQYGAGLFDDVSFTLRATLAAEEAGDATLRDQLLASLEKKDSLSPEHKTVLDIAFKKQDPLPTRVIQLHRLPTHADAGFFKTHYLRKLGPTARTAPAIRRIAIEDHLDDGRFVEALGEIEGLEPDSQTAQTHVWAAWSHLATGDTAAAQAALDRARKATGPAEWKRVAEQLASPLAGLEKNAAANVHALQAVLAYLRRGVDLFEVRGATTYKGQSIRLYIGADRSRDSLLTMFHRGDDLILAFSNSPTRTRLFITGDKTILTGPGGGLTPVVQLELDRSKDGKMQLSFGANLGTSLEQTARPLAQILDSFYFRNEAGRRQLVSDLIAKGAFPSRVLKRSEETELAWAWPHARDAHLPQLKWIMSASGMVRAVEGSALGQGRVQLKYGPGGTFKLVPPDWPALPTEEAERQRISTALFTKVMPMVFQAIEVAKEETAEPETSPPG